MIIYLHGFRSSSASVKAVQLRQYLSAWGQDVSLWCKDLPISPRIAIDNLSEVIHSCSTPPLLVGSSLGGYYATFLAEHFNLKAVLINPACRAADLLEPWVGPHQNLYTGKSFDLTAEHIQELRELHVSSLDDPTRFWVLLETGDEVLDYRLAVATYQGARMTIREGGNHGLESFPEFIPEIVSLAHLVSAPANAGA